MALILIVGGRECQITPPRTRNVQMKASSIASDQDRFDTAYEACSGVPDTAATARTLASGAVECLYQRGPWIHGSVYFA